MAAMVTGATMGEQTDMISSGVMRTKNQMGDGLPGCQPSSGSSSPDFTSLFPMSAGLER
jgi:hypothetical protein